MQKKSNNARLFVRRKEFMINILIAISAGYQRIRLLRFLEDNGLNAITVPDPSSARNWLEVHPEIDFVISDSPSEDFSLDPNPSRQSPQAPDRQRLFWKISPNDVSFTDLLRWIFAGLKGM